VGFFVLQRPEVAFSGGAIDRLLECLLSLLELRGASCYEHSDPKTPGNSDQMNPVVHAQVPPF
jgi:hypothetical protein